MAEAAGLSESHHELRTNNDHVERMLGGVSLEPLAASEEEAGGCFCLEALADCFLAGSLGVKVVVFGWADKLKEDDGLGSDR